MRYVSQCVLLLAIALCLLSCKREQKEFGHPSANDTVYVMDNETNEIVGLLILPRECGSDEIVPVIDFPQRLYEKKKFSYYVDYTEPWYDFVEKVAKLYDFPISWDPEPPPRKRSRDGDVVAGKGNFFQVFRRIVSETYEANYQSDDYDPNKISIGIITKDGAVIKRVTRGTNYVKNSYSPPSTSRESPPNPPPE